MDIRGQPIKRERERERRRESPQDFMLAYLKFLKDNNYEDKPVRPTPKAFALLRGNKEKKDNEQ